MSEMSKRITGDEEASLTSPSLLGMTVRELREHRNLSKASLAKAAQVEESVISRIESGKTRALHKPNLEAIAAALQVKPKYLLDIAYGVPPVTLNEIQAHYTRTVSADIQQAQNELIDVLTMADDRREREQARELLARFQRAR